MFPRILCSYPCVFVVVLYLLPFAGHDGFGAARAQSAMYTRFLFSCVEGGGAATEAKIEQAGSGRVFPRMQTSRTLSSWMA